MADAGADIANIATLSLGFGDRVGGVAGTEQEGCVYFDDMILHTTRCVAEQSQAVIDDLDGDCDVDWDDIGIVTGNWLEDRR
jgi:predicted TIM-barrel enzyme